MFSKFILELNVMFNFIYILHLDGTYYILQRYTLQFMMEKIYNFNVPCFEGKT